MGFLKQAYATTMNPATTTRRWGQMRTASGSGISSSGLIEQASDILGATFKMDDYLLTHCTIVASVDVEEAPNVKLGTFQLSSQKVLRKWADYLVTPETTPWINNNLDAFERQALLKAYPTFVGAHNFLEHVQLEEHSKGRVIDAAARDIGDSLYIDILVATERTHRNLIASIQSRELGTLSMGCFLPGTQVSMADGTRVAIEDVAPGDLVLTQKGNSQPVKNKQIRAWDGGIRKIKAVGVPNKIQATDNHPFFVYRSATVCACGCGETLNARRHLTPRARLMSRFKRGHQLRILNPNGSYSLEEHRRRKAQMEKIMSLSLEEVRADELQVGDFVCFPRTKMSAKRVSIGKARLLGYFLAEGSFLKYKGVPTETQFTFSLTEKETYVAEVLTLLKSEFPEACTPWTQDRQDRNTCTVHVSGRKLAAWFHALGGEYSQHKRLAPEVMGWGVETQKHLLGTWISGDGTLWTHAHSQSSGTTTSYNLACQLHTLFARVGIYARLECNVAGRSREVSQVMNGGVVVRDVETGKLPAFRLVVGQTEATKLAPYTDKAPKTSHFKSFPFRVMDHEVMFPITSIEEGTYKGWVFDMEVEGDHSYVVEGVAVHNCSIDNSTCTKCGNVAEDEPQMCSHIRYEKGNYWYDELGKKRRIAELCGHHSIEPHAGINFIDASWVRVPAFTGAVLQTILEAKELSPRMAKQVAQRLGLPPAVIEELGVRKAAFLKTSGPFDDTEDAEDVEEGAEDEPPEESSSIKDFEDEVVKIVLDRAKKRIKEELGPKDSGKFVGAPSETIFKEAGRVSYETIHNAGLLSLARVASSDIELISHTALYEESLGHSYPVALYRASLKVGPYGRYKSASAFVEACKHVLRRMPSRPEAEMMLKIGKLLSLRRRTS